MDEPLTEDRLEPPADDSPRKRLSRMSFSLPAERVRLKKPISVSAADDSPTEAAPSVADYQSVKALLHERLLDEINEEDLIGESEEALADKVQQFAERTLAEEDLPLNAEERSRLADDLQEETLGVGPLAPLMADPAVTDILVNRFNQIYVERFGRLEETQVRFRDNEHLVRIIQRIASRVGRRIDESTPMVDARLPDGSRVNATLGPVTIDGPTLSIRRFGRRRLRCAELQRLQMFSSPMMGFMGTLVKNRRNVLVSGGTGAGKSTFLAAIAESIPSHERVITIEDAAELTLDQRHVVRMETRPANLEGQGRISSRELVINSLRMRPDRILVGEVRGAEALDMLQAMNTGHDGSLTTIHANSPRDAMSRLETMVLMAGMDLPSRAIREQMVSAIDFIIHVRRFDDGARRVERISELCGLEDSTPQLQDVFVFKQTGRRGRNIEGRFVATGVVPRIVHELRERGVEIPMDWFQPQSGAVT
ncbi:MAG: CpaF family protein [Planctomycetota bacterium]